jgi:hypothetical protein
MSRSEDRVDDQFATQEMARIILPPPAPSRAAAYPRHSSGADVGNSTSPIRAQTAVPRNLPEERDGDRCPGEHPADERPADEAPGGPRPQRWRTVVLGSGELLLTGGLVILLFVVYELFITDLITAHDQTRLDHQLHEAWQRTPQAQVAAEPEPAIGRPVAIAYIPRLGADYQRVIIEGTDQAQLAQAPGHYVGAAMPGQQGNFALAGHRVGKGSPFLDLDRMQPGDTIVIETATQWLVYRVLGDPRTGSFTTDPSGIPGQEVVPPPPPRPAPT